MTAKLTENFDKTKYESFLETIKNDIRTSQLKAALSVNKELIEFYWRIGTELSKKVAHESWGAKIIQKLAKDLAAAFPGITGFSYWSLHYIKKFAEEYPDLNCATAAA